MDSVLVKRIRAEMGLTQRQFALKIGLKTQSPLSKIEDGFLNCSKYEYKIMEIFNQYREERIKYLSSQIDYLRSF